MQLKEVRLEKLNYDEIEDETEMKLYESDYTKRINRMRELTKDYDNSQKKAAKKITIACVICITFMIIEIVAAVMANSLSLMTDASHLFCDICSFALNLFSIYVSNFEGNLDMSFGYHRAEIIGALFSIFFIWALSAYILYSSIIRLFHVKTVNGYIMFITSFVSTLANLFIAYILKVHSHGLNYIDPNGCASHTHQHTIQHSYHQEYKSESECNKHKEKGYKREDKSTKSKYVNINDPILHSEDCVERKTMLENGKVTQSHCDYVTLDKLEHVHEEMQKGYERKEGEIKHKINTYGKETGKRNKKESDAFSHGHCCNHEKHKSNDERENPNQQNINPTYFKNEIDHHNDHTMNCDHRNHMHTTHEEEEQDNINLKAAYIHALGDLIQNIGVMIASLIIWYYPEYSITDPICSIIFCFIVFLTTISVIKEVLNVLMEGTPEGLNLIQLKNDLLSISGVVDVHDLHVWSLSIGKPALACHIVTHKNNAHIVLKSATFICQKKYKILHTTVQTDYPSNTSDCETYAHLKCSNLKNITSK